MIHIITTHSGIGAITVTTLLTIIRTMIPITIIVIGIIPIHGLIITMVIITTVILTIIMVPMPAGKGQLRVESKSMPIASLSKHHHLTIKLAGRQSAPIGSFKMRSICP